MLDLDLVREILFDRFWLVAGLGLCGTLGAIVGHYVLFGPHMPPAVKKGKTKKTKALAQKAKQEAERVVPRFSIAERLLHIVTLLSFVTLGATGLTAAVGYQERVTGWLWVAHAFAAPVFMLGLTAVVIMWARDGCFAWYDLKWALSAGGYLGFGHDLPAGRFNGGQKCWLWFIAVAGVAAMASGLGRMFPVLDPWGQDALYQLHRYSTLALSMGVIVHAYLGSLANPGTIQVALTGKVTGAWAKFHHPMWWERVNKQASR